MVFVKVMGLLDIISAIVIILLHFNVGTWRITLAFTCYLIMKAIAFKGNIHSIIDGAIGIYMLFLLFGFHSIITFAAAIYVLQKGAVSLFS